MKALRLIRRLGVELLRLSPAPWVARELLQRRRVTVLCYHDPRPEPFARQLRALLRAYHAVSLRQVVEASTRGAWRSLPPKPLVITLDDGHRGNHDLLPVLRRFGVRPTLFVCSGVVGTFRHFWWTHVEDEQRQRLKHVPDAHRLSALERVGSPPEEEHAERQALSAAEIEALKEVADVQAHTVDHAILPMCSHERAAYQVTEAKRQLEERHGVEVFALAYPNGSATERDKALARAAGYVCGLGLGAGSNGEDVDLFDLRRIWMDDEASPTEALVRASGVWDALRGLVRIRREAPEVVDMGGAPEAPARAQTGEPVEGGA